MLDCLVICYTYCYTKADPRQLTDIQPARVNNKYFASLLTDHKLDGVHQQDQSSVKTTLTLKHKKKLADRNGVQFKNSLPPDHADPKDGLNEQELLQPHSGYDGTSAEHQHPSLCSPLSPNSNELQQRESA